MKKLYIIRHAKSSWKDTQLDDFDRPLNKRGRHDATLMGKRLEEKQIIPDVIYSSPAKRAKVTAKSIGKKVQYNNKIVFKKDIYEADQKTLQNIVRNINDRYSIAFLIGHNPGLNELAKYYIGYKENIPTCGIIGIEFTCNHWRDTNAKCAKLIFIDYPKKSCEYIANDP